MPAHLAYGMPAFQHRVFSRKNVCFLVHMADELIQRLYYYEIVPNFLQCPRNNGPKLMLAIDIVIHLYKLTVIFHVQIISILSVYNYIKS